MLNLIRLRYVQKYDALIPIWWCGVHKQAHGFCNNIRKNTKTLAEKTPLVPYDITILP